MNNRIPVLSFFTGGGFLDMGFINAGFNIVWTNEFDNDFSLLYSEGMTSWKRAQGLISNNETCEISNTNSIKDIDCYTIKQEAFKGKLPEIFGIIGGPPCQDFSLNGNLEGFEGERGTLTEVFIDKIKGLQPTFFVMENVTGLVRSKKTKDKFSELIEDLKKHFHIDYKILNSLNFGVPQSRQRVFVVGINKNKKFASKLAEDKKGSWFPFEQFARYENALKNFKWATKDNFGSKEIAKPNGTPKELLIETYVIKKEEENEIPNADEYFKILKPEKYLDVEEGNTSRSSFKRLHRYRYSPTACYGNNEVHLHPFQNRRLSVRETLRIQSVDDSYVLTSTKLMSKKFKMIGNGVPVKLAEGVGKSMLSFINENL